MFAFVYAFRTGKDWHNTTGIKSVLPVLSTERSLAHCQSVRLEEEPVISTVAIVSDPPEKSGS